MLWPIRNPAKARRFGMSRLSGVMLHGPPGNAKTTIAKAICCEGGFAAFFHLDCATVLSAFVGEAERCLRDTFAQARAQAPAVIFMDEIESFGSKRKKDSGDADDIGVRLLATLLTEMDGVISAENGEQQQEESFGVCVIGATNLLHLVDDALLRPGRFDLLLEVPNPSAGDREAIIAHCLKRSNSSSGASDGGSRKLLSLTADISKLAAMTRDFSGAEITGAWRDGVVSCLVQHHRSLLLGDAEAAEDDGVVRLDVTSSVAEKVRELNKR